MTKKELDKYISIKKEVEQHNKQLKYLESLLIDGSSVCFEIYTILKNRYESNLKKLLKLQNKIETTIQKLDEEERILIRYRYIEGLKWEDISNKMFYSKSSLYEKRSNILMKLNLME